LGRARGRRRAKLSEYVEIPAAPPSHKFKEGAAEGQTIRICRNSGSAALAQI
jgi:hypothetical protein